MRRGKHPDIDQPTYLTSTAGREHASLMPRAMPRLLSLLYDRTSSVDLQLYRERMGISFTGRIAMIFWLMLIPVLFGQQPQPAYSLSASAGDASSGSRLSGNELLRIGEIHEHQNHFHETLTYYQLALSRFRETKQSRGAATALLRIAWVHERQGQLQEAYASLREALPISRKSSKRSGYADALLAMGRVAARLGHQDEAHNSLSEAIGLFTPSNESRGLNEALVQLGLLQVNEGMSREGLSSLQRAREVAVLHRDTERQLETFVALGDTHWLLDRVTDARAYYDEGLRLAEATHQTPHETKLRLRLAQLQHDEGQLSESIALGKRALLLSQTLRDVATEATAWSLLADLYRKMERSTDAEEAETRALAIYRAREIQVHGGR
jgi:tetratricopeptide (TPR) repeat protein